MPASAFTSSAAVASALIGRTAVSTCLRRRKPTPTQPPRATPRRANAPRMVSESSPTASVPLAPRISDVWELDFYSRPVVGLDGKKLWELIITDETGAFEYVEAVPNGLVNSRELRKRIQAAIDDAPSKPSTIRFFRSQMFNMIQLALADIGLNVTPSRKTYMLYRLIKYREENIYTQMPGYQESLSRRANTFQGLTLKVTERMPDALRCEQFAFATYPLGTLREFFRTADKSDYIGDCCPLDDNMDDSTPVGGLVAFSERAPALAAWIGGIELAFIKATLERQELVFECGLNTVFLFASITPDLKDDVRNFQKLKDSSDGLHFLAVQKSAESDEIEGMWMMSDS